ncbi:hypothetical protein BDF19DRAFT_449638 [Syncephalis fuscata]|nr:hypothetical protein BDF19DRAFT_449638 [Syncephalis fuscata]
MNETNEKPTTMPGRNYCARFAHAPSRQHGLSHNTDSNIQNAFEKARNARNLHVNQQREQQYTDDFMEQVDLEEDYLQWELKQQQSLRHSMGVNDDAVQDSKALEMALSAEASIRQELACNSMDMDNYQNDRMDDINDQESQYWEEAMTGYDSHSSSTASYLNTTNDHWTRCPGQRLVFFDESVGDLILCSYCDYCDTNH